LCIRAKTRGIVFFTYDTCCSAQDKIDQNWFGSSTPKSQKKISPFGNMSLNVTFVHHFLYWGIGGTLRWLLGTSGLKNPKNQDMLAKRTKNTDIPAVHVSEIPLYTHP
jgi:hypothetical protein